MGQLQKDPNQQIRHGGHGATDFDAITGNSLASEAARMGQKMLKKIDKRLAEEEERLKIQAIQQQMKKKRMICYCGHPSCGIGPFTIPYDA